ncbi:pirin family protein [Agitococcus lubricus]|uniref:Quercetin 2,3-dioxygenase n=1 Tax=Agitococcus lubricus TaxID=1077255 RepID=A0A2T5J2B1_9GAMM|nr:pirin family protein [Agitococcus lubricus]PTQ90663.1 hypothetical protein C8N29_10263 [Agitococcus lubricus]
MTSVRQIRHLVRGQATSDGAGVKLTRVIGTQQLPQIDPFLMLDEFRSDDANDYIAGFPEHPHRGFETVTYMLAGKMRHQDNQGNVGLLEAGSVQWMTAGRGIVHSEMPEQENGLMWGFQLWVNLPAKDKMTAPRYQDIPPQAIPEIPYQGHHVRVIAGQLAGAIGPVQAEAIHAIYWDIHLATGSFNAPLPSTHQAFIYVYQGSVSVEGRQVERGQLALLSEGEQIRIDAQTDARLLLIAGQAIREPVARYGPFVMNTQAEIMQAFADYRNGNF